MRGHGLLAASANSLRYLGHSAFLSAKGLAIRNLRAGPAFHRLLAELEESQWAPLAERQAAQDAELRAMVRHAYENVPHYRRSFDRHGVRPENIGGIDDLPKLPVLTKSEIRAAPDDFVARGGAGRLIATGWTTGTTGAPLAVQRTLRSIIFDKAILARQRHWAGVGLQDRNVAVWGTIWSNVIVPRAVRSPPYWRFNAADNQLLFSTTTCLTRLCRCSSRSCWSSGRPSSRPFHRPCSPSPGSSRGARRSCPYRLFSRLPNRSMRNIGRRSRRRSQPRCSTITAMPSAR